jgi:putative transposase
MAADNGYKNTFCQYVEDTYKWDGETVQSPESNKDFIPEKNRWQAERSFGWLNFRLRLFLEVGKPYFLPKQCSKSLL